LSPNDCNVGGGARAHGASFPHAPKALATGAGAAAGTAAAAAGAGTGGAGAGVCPMKAPNAAGSKAESAMGARRQSFSNMVLAAAMRKGEPTRATSWW
jgi:hypothetical protein